MFTEQEIDLAQRLLWQKKKITNLISDLKAGKKTLAVCEPIHNHSDLNYEREGTRCLENARDGIMQKINSVALDALIDTLKSIEEALSVLVKP